MQQGPSALESEALCFQPRIGGGGPQRSEADSSHPALQIWADPGVGRL